MKGNRAGMITDGAIFAATHLTGAAEPENAGARAPAVVTYPAPEGAPVSTDYTVTVDGKNVAVYGVPTRYEKPACFGYFDIGGAVTVEAKVNFLAGDKNVTVHPQSLGITAQRDGDIFRFKVSHPGSVTLLVNGDHQNRPLHLFINPPAEKPPADAIVFGPGMHKLGYDKPIALKDGQTVYIAGGAWIDDGMIVAPNARNIRIMGRGVLSQSSTQTKDYNNAPSAPPGISMGNCTDVTISGIVLTRRVIGWCSLAQNCEKMTLEDFHVLAPVIWSTDGFNPCNSRDVTIRRSFFRTGDDCIAIKGNTGGDILKQPHIPPDTQPPVENIAITNCVFWSDHNEVVCIGCETRAKYIRNVRVADCDVLYNFGIGEKLGVFGIIPLHGTEIRNIVFENIRVEHVKDNLFCFRYVDKIWGIPGDLSFPGTIADVTIRDVSVSPGVSRRRSEFKGWAADKQIRNVSISGLRYGSGLVRNAGDMGLVRNEHVSGVRFGDAPPPAPPGVKAK